MRTIMALALFVFLHQILFRVCSKVSLAGGKRGVSRRALDMLKAAAGDFAARQYAVNYMISRNVRAMNYLAAAVRRRSLAPIC